jgi:hypothetical protein
VIVRYFVWRWRGSSWRLDSWDQSDPEGYRTEQEAQARVARLLAYHLRSRGRPMFPPPVITLGDMPRMKPRPKERKHRFSHGELNGASYSRQPVPESRQSR